MAFLSEEHQIPANGSPRWYPLFVPSTFIEGMQEQFIRKWTKYTAFMNNV